MQGKDGRRNDKVTRGPGYLNESFTFKLCKVHITVQLLTFYQIKRRNRDFPGGPVVKNLPCNARDTGLIPGQRTPKSHMPEEQLSLQARTTEPEHHS